MKTLLRSTIIADPTDNADAHLENFRLLDASGVDFQEPEDVAIWEFVRSFVLQHHHPPDITTILSHYQRTNEIAIADRVQSLRSVRPRSRGDFRVHLDAKAEDRRKVLVGKLLQEAGEIVTRGMQVEERGEKRILHGPTAAVRHFLEGAHAIVTPTTGERLSGNVTYDGADFLAQYERVAADPLAGVGQFVGLRQMDDALQGAKKFELWTHAAFTGGMKSTLMLNWAYTQAVYYGSSSLIFSLEMPYSHCRNILYAMHSCHEKFERIHPPLEYQKIKEGTLSPKEKWFLVEHVVPDFNQKDQYGSILIEVADPEKVDFTVSDIRSRAETLYAKNPFKLLFVDHALLVAPRHWVASTTDRLNEVIRDCKKLAMSFNKGAGMAVVLLFQISREGYKSALKARGLDMPGGAAATTGKPGQKPRAPSNYVYNLTHLSYANEAERCVIPSTFCMVRGQGHVVVGDVLVGDYVWSSTGWRQVLGRFDNGVRRVWRLTTDRGSVLDCTAPHRVRVLMDGHVGWKAVSDLNVGDYVVGAFVQQEDREWPHLPAINFNKHEHRVNREGREVCVPTRLNEDLSYLLGAWDGDGTIHPDGIAFTGNRKEDFVRDAIVSRVRSCFQGNCTVSESPSRPGSFDVRLFSRPVKRWFEEVAGGRGLSVPSVIRAAPRAGVCAYLQGLFDTDGWVNKAGVVGISMKGIAENFLREVQMLLSGLKIDSHLSISSTLSRQTGKRYKKVQLRVRSREGRANFASLIGFTQPEKQSLLDRIICANGMSDRRGSTQTYPMSETFLSVWNRCPHDAASGVKVGFSNVAAKLRQGRHVSRGAVEYLVRHADQHMVVGPDVDFLKQVLTLHVMRVLCVEDTGRDEAVIDLEVEGDHEYLTGPVLSHNSSDIVTCSWLDNELAKDGKLLLQQLKSRDQKPFDPFMCSIYWPCRRLRTLEDPTVQDMTSVGAAMDIDDLL